MKVRITIEVDDDDRLAFSHHYGREGCLATRDEIRHFGESEVETAIGDMRDDWDRLVAASNRLTKVYP